MHLSPRIVSLLIATNLATLGAFLSLILSSSTPRRTSFEEINAERINVVSPAGRTVIAISNKERIAAPVLDGKTYPVTVSEGREHMAGMIFFNQEGDEMGGLVFNSFKLPNGKIAGIGHLSFDRYSDNQVVALQYKENARTVLAGLTFYDRPADGSFKKSLDLVEEARDPSTTPARLAEIKQVFSEIESKGGLGVERVFIGSKNQSPQLVLKDTSGLVRARLMVDANNDAKLEFLDDTGKVTAQFPDTTGRGE